MNPLPARALIILILTASALHAQVSQLINHQGRVAVGGVNFDGSGRFKFAIVNTAGTTSYWSNDGTSTAGSEPAAAVTLTVKDGSYSVLLGDTSIPNMDGIEADAFNPSAVLLRVWFGDGTNGSQLLAPDQQLQLNGGAAATYAWQERIPAGETPVPLFPPFPAVWTGSEMIVWGPVGGGTTAGGRYKPATNTWTPVSLTNAPEQRTECTAVWTGSEMIVWGGFFTSQAYTLNTGGRYNPATNSWTAMSTIGAPRARARHTAVWTGTEMIVWGGSADYYTTDFIDGGRYNPATNTWTAIPYTHPNTPSVRGNHNAIWTGGEMIVWGGTGAGSLNTGGRYDPAANRWTAMTTTGAPQARNNASVVWTGSEMIVWGGFGGSNLNTGGRYNPATNSWTAVSTTGAPRARYRHTAVWTGSEMIVWGGNTSSFYNDGGRYNPAADSWMAVTTAGAPAGRHSHTAVWTGTEMIVWGGLVRNPSSPGSYWANDTFSYASGCEPFRINTAFLENGDLTFRFPSMEGRNYTLWHSDTLAAGSWTDTGIPSLTGTGAILSLTIPAPAGVLQRFFRIQAEP
jgi:N-acetylneuraminic acid mutarotase